MKVLLLLSVTALALLAVPVAASSVDRNLVDENPEEETSADDKDKSVQNQQVEENAVSVEENPVKENPVEENPVEENPVEENPVKENPVRENPVKENPVKENPVKENPVKENPVKENPVKENPVEENPEEGTSADDGDRSGRLLAIYTTKTKALFVTTTINALSTCFSATTTACGKRRKRNAIQSPVDFTNMEMSSNAISPSLADSWNSEGVPMVPTNRDRKSFTVWSTLFSTYTITTTSFFSGTTVSVSGACSVAGLSSSCFG